MNYDTYDCRLHLSAPKAPKAQRRKNPAKSARSARGTTRLYAALRAVTTVGVALWALTTVASAQFTIQPLTETTSKDAKIYQSVPNSSLQSDLNIVALDVGAHFLSLVQFDLSSYPFDPNQVTNAYLTLYCTGLGVSGGPAVGGVVTLSPVTDSWRENSGDPGTAPLATYTNFFGPSPTLHFGPATSQAGVTGAGFVTWDVTNTVKAWFNGTQANNGFLVQLNTAGADIGFADVDSAPGVVGSAPQLTVVPEPGSALLAFAGAGVFFARRRRAIAS